MSVNGGGQGFVLLRFSGNFSQRLDYPLLLGLNELLDFMFGDVYRRDNFDFTGRYNDPRLRGSRTAPNLVGKWQVRNDGSLYWRFYKIPVYFMLFADSSGLQPSGAFAPLVMFQPAMENSKR